MSKITMGFNRAPCRDCSGTGKLRIDSENINERFVVEKQTLITEYPRCRGLGFLLPGTPGAA